MSHPSPKLSKSLFATPCSCCSTICLLQVYASCVKKKFSFVHGCVLNKVEEVRIPCYAHCIQMQISNLCTYLGELPNFIYNISMCSSLLIFLGILVGINDIEGIRLSCLCILYSNANYNYAQTLGSFLISFRSLSFQSYHNIYLSFGIFLLSSAFWII